VIDYRPALRNPTGAGEYTRGLAASLLALDETAEHEPIEVTLFSSSWKDRLTLPPELRGAEIVDLQIPVTALNFAWHRARWPPIETLAKRSFDIAHSSHPLLMPSSGAAQVITIHDLNFLRHPERTRAEIRRDYPALVRDHASLADAVLVPSRYTAGEVERELGVSSERITICPPGHPAWQPRPAPPDGGYVLFVGTLEPRKNLGALLDAYEQLLGDPETGSSLPDLVLAGGVSPEGQAWVDRIGRAPLAGHVRHAGYVSPSERQALYEGAMFLVLPSWEEGFGLPVLEAMTIGVPVIAADRSALPEVLGETGLLVSPDDPEAIAAAMRRLITDDALRGACAAQGVLRARHFTWSATAERVREAYELAVAHRRARQTIS
jgi:glycosyltransferase involved in cell wall biosynthesis